MAADEFFSFWRCSSALGEAGGAETTNEHELTLILEFGLEFGEFFSVWRYRSLAADEDCLTEGKEGNEGTFETTNEHESALILGFVLEREGGSGDGFFSVWRYRSLAADEDWSTEGKEGNEGGFVGAIGAEEPSGLVFVDAIVTSDGLAAA